MTYIWHINKELQYIWTQVFNFHEDKLCFIQNKKSTNKYKKFSQQITNFDKTTSMNEETRQLIIRFDNTIVEIRFIPIPFKTIISLKQHRYLIYKSVSYN